MKIVSTNETSAPKEETKTEDFKFDEDKARNHLVELAQYNLSFAGKTGYNPFFFMENELFPLETRYKKGERTRELWDSIFKLEKKEPKI